MKAQAYHDLQDRQRKELSDFPIAYAFNKKQLEAALKKLGANDISECCSVMGVGDIVKKENAKALLSMLERHNKELHDLLIDPDLATDIFEYEMDNHEYAINWSGDADVLSSLGLTEDDISRMGLQLAYETARRRHMKKAHEEWGLI